MLFVILSTQFINEPYSTLLLSKFSERKIIVSIFSLYYIHLNFFGWLLVSIEYCSVANPKVSQPIGCLAYNPFPEG